MRKLSQGFTKFPNARIADGTYNKLTQFELRVYLTIAMHADYNTGRAYPGYSTLRKYLKTTTSGTHIKHAIDRLEELGLIETHLTDKLNKDGSLSKVKQRIYNIIA